MAKKNMKKIVLGVILISFALFLFVISVYFLNIRYGLFQKLKIQLFSMSLFTQKTIKKDSFRTKVLNLECRETSERVSFGGGSEFEVAPYAEGLLWIDRKTGRYVVTLGRKSGLIVGSCLDVYQEETMLGEVIVESVSEHVSVVRLTLGLLNLLTQDYYKVFTK